MPWESILVWFLLEVPEIRLQAIPRGMVLDRHPGRKVERSDGMVEFEGF